MKTFLAKNPRQLDICLKMLYSEHISVPFPKKWTEIVPKKPNEIDIR